MTKSQKIDFVFAELEKRYAGATTELVYNTPFQLIVAVVMSAQTTDKQVNKVTVRFFDTIQSPVDLLKISGETWEHMISGVNYYKNKAKNIYRMAQILAAEGELPPNKTGKAFYKKRGYWIPDRQEQLMMLPGVGEKTAKVILQVLYKQPVIAVDTHVHRVMNRLGIVKTNEPLQTSRLLEKVVPDRYKLNAHHGLIMFGRYHCTARNPKCETCPFNKICPRYKSLLKKKK